MFLEDSTAGREVWRHSYLSSLNKVSELFPVILQQESLRDGPLCYIAVKVHDEHVRVRVRVRFVNQPSQTCVADLRTVISAGVFADVSAVVQ